VIEILRKFSGRGACDGYPLSKNRFLESLLVEMVSENYRQLVSEALIRSGETRKMGLLRLDPPLRGNERVASSLVQAALSRMTIRSRTEGRVERELANGRVDHLTWYANHVIGVEFKVARMALRLAKTGRVEESHDGNEKVLVRVDGPWKEVVEQSESALRTLEQLKQQDSKLYPRPISLPLLLVVGQRRVKRAALDVMEDSLEEYRQAFIDALPSDRVDYLAVYTAPKEHRVACERAHGKADRDTEGVMYVPCYAFLSGKTGDGGHWMIPER